MKRVFVSGAYVWTASSAGWTVLWGVTGLAEVGAVAVGCLAMAGVFLICSEAT